MENRKYVLISGFNIHDNNRGTAALSYGAISFLKEKNLLTEKQILVNFRRIKNFFKTQNRGCFEEKISTADGNWTHITFNVFFWEVALYMRLGILLPFTPFGKAMRQISLVAAINGGDGFSDIYSTETFLGRLYDIGYAMHKGIPVIILPQTLGPFRDERNLWIAKRILKYANMVYVRDDKFTDELKNELIRLGMDDTKEVVGYHTELQYNLYEGKVYPYLIGYSGDSSLIPTWNSSKSGFMYRNTDYSGYSMWNGLEWVNEDGTLFNKVNII